MTLYARLEIDEYIVPAAILLEEELASKSNVAILRMAINRMPAACALRRFPRIITKTSSRHLEIVEIDIEGFKSCSLKSFDAENAVSLKLKTDILKPGLIPLKAPPTQMPTELGRILVFVVLYQPPKKPNTRLISIFGLLPWTIFKTTDFDHHGKAVRAIRLLRNREIVDAASTALYESLSVPPPLFETKILDLRNNQPPPSPPSTRAIASFALMWHAAGKAYGNSEEGRKRQSLLLTRRSCRFFGEEPVRDAIFGRQSGFDALGCAMADMRRNRRAAWFVCRQISSAFEMLFDMETKSSDLASVIHYRDTITPLINALANVCTPEIDPMGIVAPLNFRVTTIKERLNDDEITEYDAMYLTKTENDDDMSYYTKICASYTFGGGNSLAVDQIILSRFRDVDKPVIRKGIVYTCDTELMKSYAVAALELYLTESAGAEVESGMGAIEKILEDTLPTSLGMFSSSEPRNRTLDDCYRGTRMFDQLVSSRVITGTMLGRVERKETSEIPLPEDFDAIQMHGLYANVSSEPSSDLTDPLAVELSLLSIAHRDECHHKDHIVVEYDRKKRTTAIKQFHEASENALEGLDVDLALIDKASSKKSGKSKLDDIEDLVDNLHHNRALPLCVEVYSQRLLSGGAYLNNFERVTYYKLLASLDIPSLTFEMIKRHMLQVSPSSKIREHINEVSNFPNMVRKAHERSATESQKYALKRSSATISHEEALERTTAAPRCEAKAKNGSCPYTSGNVEQMLIRSGIDERRAGMISAMVRDGVEPKDVGKVCGLHLHASMTPDEHSHWPAPFNTEKKPYINRPRDFVRASAQHRLRQREDTAAAASETKSEL